MRALAVVAFLVGCGNHALAPPRPVTLPERVIATPVARLDPRNVRRDPQAVLLPPGPPVPAYTDAPPEPTVPVRHGHGRTIYVSETCIDCEGFGELDRHRFVPSPEGVTVTEIPSRTTPWLRRSIPALEALLDGPESPKRTPETMLRLAESYDASVLDGDPAAPSDHRCAIALLRDVVARFPAYARLDTALELLALDLRAMGAADEAAVAMRALACPSLGAYVPELALDGPRAPTGLLALACGRSLERIRHHAPESITPPESHETSAQRFDARRETPAPRAPSEPPTIPGDFRACVPMRGPEGGPSQHASAAWFLIGQRYADQARDDASNALAIAADEQVIATLDARARDHPPTVTDDFLRTRALLGAGEAWHRTQDSYPMAFATYVRILDLDTHTSGPRAPSLDGVALWRMAALLYEREWSREEIPDTISRMGRCQRVVELAARPPTAVTRPFDCVGLGRLTAPYAPDALLESTDPWTVPPMPGLVTLVPLDRPWAPAVYRTLADVYFEWTMHYEAITVYTLLIHLFPLEPAATEAVERVAEAYRAQRQFDAVAPARQRLLDYIAAVRRRNPTPSL